MSSVRIRSLAPETWPRHTCRIGRSRLPPGQFRWVHERLERIETRLGELTTGVAVIERDLAAVKAYDAATQLRLDSMDRRIERIEKRLSLIETYTVRANRAF